MATDKYRIEHDLLGNRQVPADAYYGVHTLRAVENFPITGTPISIYPDLIRALACIKQAAALANQELELLDKAKTAVIVKACEELRAGKLHEHFVVDVIQGGAGTSTNMNANEVIANRALEHLGHQRGARRPETRRDHRHSANDRAKPRRSDAGLRRVRAGFGRAQARGSEALQDLQRSAVALERPARGPG